MKLAAVTSLVLIGCVAQDPATDPDTDTDTDTNADPLPAPDPTGPVASGTYDVRSTFDLTIEVLLPEMIATKVVLLRQFSENPARTLFDAAEAAGVPAVAELRDNLPAYIEDKLEGWINDQLERVMIDGVALPQHAANLAALAEQSLGEFALDSTLAIADTTATHALVTLDLGPAGLAATFPLSALPASTATATCASGEGTFSIGAHGYALPYGEYVWQAINAEVDIRAFLGAAVNCPALANTISNKCYLGYCVGHEAELVAICEQGLDEAVARVHAEFTATQLDLIQLDAGTASLAADGRAMIGTWAAQINAGQGLRDVSATFTATK